MSLFQPHLLAQYLVSADFLHGAIVTLALSVASVAAGLAVGLILAVGQEAPLSAVRSLAWFYIWLFRGTPVLLQLVFAFNVLPVFGIVLPGFACAVLALGLNEGAYMAEIMRAGIRAVGPGQRLAARPQLGPSPGGDEQLEQVAVRRAAHHRRAAPRAR